MPWDTTCKPTTATSYPIFEKPIAPEADAALENHIAQRISELAEIEKPFLYFAVGTDNSAANGTNHSSPGHATAPLLAKQQSPAELLADARGAGYNPIVLNIDYFGGTTDATHFSGLYPLAGTMWENAGKEKKIAATSIAKVIEYFKLILEKGGKILFLNATADLPHAETNPPDRAAPTFMMYEGIRQVICSLPKGSGIAFASAYLEERPYCNLYKWSGGKMWTYNLAVPAITFEALNWVES